MTPLTDVLSRGADVVVRALPLLGDAALKGTVILGVAAGATALMRRSAAATRHLVWTTAVASVLALPLLEFVAPRWNLPIAPAPWAAVAPLPAVAPVTAVAPVAAVAPVVGVVAPAPVTGVITAAPVGAEIAVVAPAAGLVAVATAPERAAAPHLSALAWVGLVWAFGALVVLARLALGTLGLSRLVRRAAPADDATWVMLLQRLARQLGIRRPVTLLVGRTGTVPVTWGVVYPIVLLPADADAWSEERRRAVLLHELAHVERFDAFTHVLSQVALALFWFHPLVVLAARRLRAERERACDDVVLAVGTRPSEYAGDLLELVQTLGEASPAAAALAMARRSEFEGRLLAILDPALPRIRTTRRGAAAACAVAAVAAVPLAGARAGQPPAPSVPDAPVVATVPAAPAPSYIVNHGPTPEHAPAAPMRGTPATLGALGMARGRLAEQVATLSQKVGVLAGCRPRAGRHVSVHSSDGEHTQMMISNAEHCLEVDAVGRITFTDDDTDIDELSTGGLLSIAETRGGVTRVAVLRERGGRVERTYTANGDVLSAEAGEQWLRTVIPVLARESTIGVPARVARIRARRGVPGVLDALREISSDGVKRAWFEALLAGGRLSSDDLRQMALAAQSISSDGDKSSVLRAVAERAGNDPSVGMAVVTAANTISSDGDRRSVLTRVSTAPAATGAVLGYAVRAAASISSDGDKASVLRTINARAADLPAVRAAIVDVSNSISSDGDRAGVLTAVLGTATDEPTLVDALRSARGISSDGDKKQVLVAALARTTLAADRVREAFFTTADQIASDGDHAEVLLATLRRAELAPAALPKLLRSAQRIASDGDKANVLSAVARRPRALDDQDARAAFFAALKTVASGSDYRRVMEIVAR
jgi:beta-lactamase regulating signal transducer with metallopeptidase domain